MRYDNKEEFITHVRQNCPILIDMRALDPQMTETYETKLWYTYNQHMDANEKRLEAEKKLYVTRLDRDRLRQQVNQLQNEARNFGLGVFLGASTTCVIVSGLWAAFAA